MCPVLFWKEGRSVRELGGSWPGGVAGWRGRVGRPAVQVDCCRWPKWSSSLLGRGGGAGGLAMLPASWVIRLFASFAYICKIGVFDKFSPRNALAENLQKIWRNRVLFWKMIYFHRGRLSPKTCKIYGWTQFYEITYYLHFIFTPKTSKNSLKQVFGVNVDRP